MLVAAVAGGDAEGEVMSFSVSLDNSKYSELPLADNEDDAAAAVVVVVVVVVSIVLSIFEPVVTAVITSGSGTVAAVGGSGGGNWNSCKVSTPIPIPSAAGTATRCCVAGVDNDIGDNDDVAVAVMVVGFKRPGDSVRSVSDVSVDVGTTVAFGVVFDIEVAGEGVADI